MRILIACTYDYWNQNHVWIAKSAYSVLKNKFKDVDITTIPFYNSPNTYLDQALGYRGFSVNQADKVITFGPFAHLVEHNNKYSYITSHLKNFYELWNNPLGELSNGISDKLKSKINHLDLACLSEAKASYCFYSKIQNRHPEVKITQIKTPKISLSKNLTLSNDGSILLLGDYNHQNNFSVIIKSLAKLQKLTNKFIFAGKKQRIDIYDSIRKTIDTSHHRENIKLVSISTPTHLNELISSAAIIIDTSIENDTYQTGLVETIRQRKAFYTFSNSGLTTEDLFSTDGFNILEPNEEFLTDFFEKYSHESELLTLKKHFDSIYNYYENTYTSNFEDTLV